MGKVQFNLNGKDTSVGGPGPRAKQVLDFITRIPDGKYFDAQGVGDCLKVTKGAVQQAARGLNGDLDGHYLLVPNQSGGGGATLVYGSKKSIAALKKQLQEQDII